MADLNNPRFWQQMYEPPVDSRAQQTSAMETLEIEEGDLDAVLDPAASRAAEAAIDHDAVAAMVERMVSERIAAMLATGQLVAGAPGGAPAARPVEVAPTLSTSPLPPAMGSTPEARPPRRRQATPPGLRAVPPGRTSSPGLQAARAWEQGTSSSQPSLRPIARPAKTSPQPQTQSPPPPPPRTAGPRPAPPAPTPAPAASALPPQVAAAMWERTPALEGGQAGLLKAQNLEPDAISLLVMIDGTTTLRGLRTLVPHLDDTRFLSIIRDAVKQGVISLS